MTAIGLRRSAGKLARLEEAIAGSPLDGEYGIGHTRWATHGAPTEENAHPHRDCHGTVAVVHNGIIEDYQELKKALEAEGHKFTTEVDTEVIAHLVEKHLNGRGAGGATPVSLEDAVRAAVKQLKGVFALAIISTRDPSKMVAVRQGPSTVIGLGKDEYFVASDVPAILYPTRDLFFLADGDVAVLTPNGVKLMDFQGEPVTRRVHHISWDPILAEKGGFKHFMQKEIFEQPRAVRDTLLGRVSLETGRLFLEEIGISEADLRELSSVRIVGCGTSWHAGLAGKFLIEDLARVPVEVDYGSEFRYRNPILNDKSLVVLISQSGETADTLAAQREAQLKGSKTLAICNVVGSMLTREASGSLYTHAGPEIGVASTKAFTAQITALTLFALYLAQVRGTLSAAQLKPLLQELLRLPQKMETVLQRDEDFDELARQLFRFSDFLYLGRGIHYPIALAGALDEDAELVAAEARDGGARAGAALEALGGRGPQRGPGPAGGPGPFQSAPFPQRGDTLRARTIAGLGDPRILARKPLEGHLHHADRPRSLRRAMPIAAAARDNAKLLTE